MEYGIYSNRNAYIDDDYIYVIQNSNSFPAKATIFQTDLKTLETKDLYTFSPPSSASLSEAMFLNDFLVESNNFYILIKYYSGKFNTPTFEGHPVVVKVNSKTMDVDTFYLKSNLPSKIGFNRIISFNNGLLIFGFIPGTSLATGNLLILNLDLNGNLIWQYQTPSISSIYDVKDILPLKDQDVLLASYDSYFDYSDLQLYTRWTVTKYDVENKKIVWSNYWDEPRKPYIWGTAKMIKTKKEGEYFLMANDYVGNDTSSYTTGKIVKFNDKGQRLWQKRYYYNNKRFYLNKFFNIIMTTDSNYLIVGDENWIQTAWLVKIDEDGNILPLDTTSAAIDIDVADQIPEVKLYPNPASHTIIINQGEITDMTYQLIDISGAVVKTIPLPHAHHHVVWDISDVASGTYVLRMMQSGKLIGSKQQVVVK